MSAPYDWIGSPWVASEGSPRGSSRTAKWSCTGSLHGRASCTTETTPEMVNSFGQLHGVFHQWLQAAVCTSRKVTVPINSEVNTVPCSCFCSSSSRSEMTTVGEQPVTQQQSKTLKPVRPFWTSIFIKSFRNFMNPWSRFFEKSTLFAFVQWSASLQQRANTNLGLAVMRVLSTFQWKCKMGKGRVPFCWINGK